MNAIPYAPQHPIQSISDEVAALWKHYNREIRPHVASLEAEKPANIFHAAQSYFVVFDAAGSLVGRIPTLFRFLKGSDPAPRIRKASKRSLFWTSRPCSRR
jgi:hypothetical protein